MPSPNLEDDERFEDEDDEPISLGGEAEGDGWREPNLGPDDRDRDLMDGSWEERYYQGRNRQRDWNGIMTGIGLLVVLAIVLPAVLVLIR